MVKHDFTVIEDKKEIKQAQLAFAKNMIKKAAKDGDITVGYQGGNAQMHAFWFKGDKFWWAYEPLPPGSEKIPRWWNAFGIRQYYRSDEPHNGEPHWGKQNSISCEINIPLSGNTWQTAGIFVKDPDNEIYIAHTGKIGGGRKGIGKTAFVDNFSGTNKWHQVSGSRGEKDVVIISNINDPNLLDNVGFFVKAVKKIKNDITEGKIKKTPKLPRQKNTDKFSPEHMGPRRSYSVNDRIQADNYHGTVVNHIKEICEKQGYLVRNNKRMDLVIQGKSKKSLMEVKTDLDTYSRYEAIGQLFYYSLTYNLPKNTKLVAVFPKPKITEFKKVLDKLGIKYVTYTKAKKQPKFDSSLDRILKDL